MIEKSNEQKRLYYAEFKSLNEFNEYLNNTPFNEAFRWNKHASVEGNEKFTHTKSWEEASNLLKNGWDDMAKKLTKKIEAKSMEVEKTVRAITAFDVCGYQASVPRYLQGIPTNMVNKKMVVVKQKVITINKCINYSCRVTAEQIEEESIKAFQIIKKLEAQGLRVNLNVISGTQNDRSIIAKVRVKNANERLNVAKMAFVMCHPSMLRRMFFRFLEVYPKVTSRFVGGYGFPIFDSEMKNACENEYYLPPFISENVENLDSMKCYLA